MDTRTITKILEADGFVLLTVKMLGKVRSGEFKSELGIYSNNDDLAAQLELLEKAVHRTKEKMLEQNDGILFNN